MINDEDLVEFADAYIGICEALGVGIEGKDIDGLNDPVKQAIVDFGKCARSFRSHMLVGRNNGVFLVQRTTSTGRSRYTSVGVWSLGYFPEVEIGDA